MPTYTVTSLQGCLDAAKREQIASEITRIHSGAMGAPTYFAQVIFAEVQPSCYFVGGAPLRGHQVFVNGQIRAGRTVESKDKLISEIADAVTAVSKLSKNNVWVYITDLLPRQMVEFGQVLPEPGDEERWAAALPGPDRAHMQSFVPARH